MENKQGFYSVEPLNSELTRIALVWNNTVEEGYGNRTVSKEIIDVEELPEWLHDVVTRNDIDVIAKELQQRNNVKEGALYYEVM